MTGLPDADYAAETTRFSIAISHTSPTGPVTLYAGFGYDGVEAHVYKWTTAAGKLEHLAGRERCRHGLGLLRRAVLLRQRNRGRSAQPQHRLRGRPVQLRDRLGWDLPVERRRWDVAEPRLGSASGLPRVRVRSNDPATSRRQRRRRLVQRGPRRPPDRASPLNRRTGRRQRCGRLSTGQFTSIATNPAWTIHSIGNAHVPRRGSGAERRTTGRCASRQTSTSVDGLRERRRWAGARRPDRMRTTCTAPTSASSPYRWTDHGQAATSFFTNQSIHEGHQPGRSVRVLHPVGDEQGEPESAVPGHLSGVPYGQREGAVGRQRAVEADQR